MLLLDWAASACPTCNSILLLLLLLLAIIHDVCPVHRFKLYLAVGERAAARLNDPGHLLIDVAKVTRSNALRPVLRLLSVR